MQLGVQLGGRFFNYTESPANTPNTRPFSVFGAPALAIEGEIYPAATTGITVLSDIGIQAAFAQYFGLSSKTSDDRVFETNFNRLQAGLRYRLRLAPRAKRPVTLYFDGQFGMLNFGFDPVDERSKEIANETASASYSFLRAGIEARIPLGARFALRPAIGYLGPLSGGDVHDRFRDASLSGVDMALRATIEVLTGLEISTGLKYERYAATYTPIPGDAFVAGGSLDEFLFIEAGAAYVF